DRNVTGVQTCALPISYPVDGMVVIPCSTACLAQIANGVSSTLIERAADVCLKEGRKLILAIRDTPFSRIHLENMLRAQEAGAERSEERRVGKECRSGG